MYSVLATRNMDEPKRQRMESNSSSGDLSKEAKEERLHFQRIIHAFRYYRVHSLKRLIAAEKHYNNLPSHHRDLIPDYLENLRSIRKCTEQNFEIIKLIIADTDVMFENIHHESPASQPGFLHPASSFDMDKVKSTLKQIVRDWSEDGELERAASYQPVLDEITLQFPPDKCDPSQISVLVPGAGLGRLAYEIAKLGYTCQGNEFSLFMLFTSNFILNKCKKVKGHTLYPWVHHFCNNMSSTDQTHAILFPDANPSALPINANFSMAAGDFLEVYTEPDRWECVATVFFLDTAHNIIAYMETIHRILKPGGCWINFGPLLYHFADMPDQPSIELSYEDVRKVAQKLNFEIVKERTHVPACYTHNPSSMLKYEYDCVFLVARKPQMAPANGVIDYNMLFEDGALGRTSK